MIKINVIFVHGIELSTFNEKIREIGEGTKFALYVLRGQPLKRTSVQKSNKNEIFMARVKN